MEGKRLGENFRQYYVLPLLEIVEYAVPLATGSS